MLQPLLTFTDEEAEARRGNFYSEAESTIGKLSEGSNDGASQSEGQSYRSRKKCKMSAVCAYFHFGLQTVHIF